MDIRIYHPSGTVEDHDGIPTGAVRFRILDTATMVEKYRVEWTDEVEDGRRVFR